MHKFEKMNHPNETSLVDDVPHENDVNLKPKIEKLFSAALTCSPARAGKISAEKLMEIALKGNPCTWDRRRLEDDVDICTVTLEGGVWKLIHEHVLCCEIGTECYAMLQKLVHAHGENPCSVQNVADFYNDMLNCECLNVDIIMKHAEVPIAVKILLIPDIRLKEALFPNRTKIFVQILSGLPLHYVCAIHDWINRDAGSVLVDKVS